MSDEVDSAVAAIRDNREHGAAALSIRACEALRDRATELDTTTEDDEDRAALADLARDLRTARPSMVVVENRVNRVMDGADADPAAVADRARSVREEALAADGEAADHAARRLDGADHVLTLSRSGTVRETLAELAPDRVTVVESRPGGEGVDVAERLADEYGVTLVPDSAVAHALATSDVDAVTVGADTVLPDGRVVNKVGTRGTLLAAAHEGLPAVVVAARDKVSPHETTDLEPRDPAELYDGDAPLDVLAPTFDVSPAGVATLVTEDGALDASEVRAVADRHRERARWADEVAD